MRLSLSMIVKNEERFLPGCLESIKDLVDEMIIVDTGSTDNTKGIARDFGARIYDFKWCDDFSAARNESLRNTTGDWILYLDADERIDKAFHSRIRRMISSGKVDAFLLNLKSKIGTGEDCQYHIVPYPRLFRKIKGVHFVGEVHEQITTSLTALGARILASDVLVEHLGYAQDSEVILEKARRNHRLLLAQLHRGKNYGYGLYQLGQTEIALGQVEEGLAHLREALKVGGFGKSVEASIHGAIAENLFKKGDFPGALAACAKSLGVAPRQAFSHMMMGEIYVRTAEYDKATESFTRAVEKYRSVASEGKTSIAIESLFEIDVVYSKLGRAAALAGDVDTARRYLGMAAENNPQPRKVAEFIELLVRNRLYTDAFEAANHFKQFEGEDWYLRIVSSAKIETGDFAGAAALLDNVSEHDIVSLSSLANCKMRIGDFEGADDAFRKAVGLGYDDPQGIELYGLAQFKLGKYADAAGTLSKAVEKNPANARAAKFAQAALAQAAIANAG